MSDTDTMLHLVAYDISSDRLRTKIHKLLERYGSWTQFSLFECFLSHRQSIKLIDEITALLQTIKDDSSHVRFYIMSRDDAQRTVTIGGEPPHEAEVFIT